MNISERQGEILNNLVQDYIQSAHPISSEFLEKKHSFGLSPATLRIEMQKLTDGGFLSQPHTSAGRVPTDKGYRFFVDNLPKDESADFEGIFPIENIFKLTKFISETSSNFVFLHSLGEDFSRKEGWEEILKEPEFEDKDFILNFTDFLEDFEEGVDDLELNSDIKIYIGKENPLSKRKDFSIILSRCLLPEVGETIFSILGPKRMNYQKNINIMNSLVEALSNYSSNI
jgi:heat-inducible transcriptional repressor